ncbi:hypothetical protein BSKO_00737 [Bryopsis sp. KO-2023]|nr:hypothetical protein BSKO_00737 [Bryopsis sp. KO-2023]
MPADMYIQKMHSVNNQKLGLSQCRPSGGVDLTSSDYQRRFLGQASFPVRLSPPPQRGQSATRHDREESTSDNEALSLEILQQRPSRGSPQHRGSVGSTNTSRSTNRGYGHGEGSSSRRRPSGELGLIRQTSGSTDTLPRLSRRRSLGSAGTHKTESSSGRLPNRSAAWVARHSNVHGPGSSTHRPLHKDGQPMSKRRMDEESTRVGSRQEQHQPDSPMRLSSHGSPKFVRNGITERVIMPDQRAYCTSPKHTLVVSPRNRPQQVERPAAEARPSRIARPSGGGVTVPSNMDLIQNNKNRKPQGEWQEENGQSESHTQRSAVARAEEWGELAADCEEEEKPIECQGLTKDALQLLLKLKEDEEVRQLRQRAVVRWLNHIPKPPPHVMAEFDDCGQSSESDRGSSTECSETVLESVTPRGSREDLPCPTPPQDKMDMSFVGKTSEPLVGKPVECPSVHEEQELKTTDDDDGSDSSDGLVPKPEFEFYNSVDEENLRAELVRSKNNGGTDCMDTPRCRSVDILKTKHDSRSDRERKVESAPVAVCGHELGAIPEGESDRESSIIVTDGDPDLESIKQRPPPKDVFAAPTQGKELTELEGVLRPSRMAAVRWTMTLSSIGEWPGGKADVHIEAEEASPRQPDPDLEIAVDVQERLNSKQEKHSSENMEGIELMENDNTYPTSPGEEKKGRRLSWYSSEDCDSSRIAVGVNIADGSKSCGSGNRTPTYQSPRSMYSEEFGLKFHVKYTIPEDAVVTGGSQRNDQQSDLAPSQMETRSEPTGLMCDPPGGPTPAQIPAPITDTNPTPNPACMTPRHRRRTGVFEYSPSGSLSDNFQLGLGEGPGEGDQSGRPKCPSPLYDHDEAASEPPEGTYWLPEFCQKVVLDAEARMEAAETKSEEPEKWHMNPLSNSGENRHPGEWHQPKSKNCRSCGPSTLNRSRSQSQWDIEQISGDSDPWGWSRRVSERAQGCGQGKSKWGIFKRLRQRGSPARQEKCFRFLSILPGMGTCWRKPA